MPTYQYECQCGHRWSRFKEMRSARADPERCPKGCPGRPRRLIGPGSGVIFRGPGFHCNDYGGGSRKK